MTDQETIEIFLKRLVKEITKKYAHEIEFIILFGSAARGEFKIGISDIDLVIQLKSPYKRKEVEDFATKIFWQLDKKHNTQFKKVLSTTKPKNFTDKLLKFIEKSTNLYVPIFVFPPGWIDWEKGRLERPLWKPVSILLLHQTLIFEKFKHEGRILFGKDIREKINPKITFWERWKALQIPFYISLFAVLISPVFPKRAVKYSTKATLYQLDSVLDFLGIYKKGKEKKIRKFKDATSIQIETKILGLYFKSTLAALSNSHVNIFKEALDVKTGEVGLSKKESYQFILRVFWFILRVNWSVLIKRYITKKNIVKIIIAGIFLTIISYFVISFIATYKLTHQNLKPLTYTPQTISNNYEIVNFPARSDSHRLSGWLFTSENSNKVIILVSGSEQNRIDPGFASHKVARDLLGSGFNVLMFDFRGRGLSQESAYTIGAFEKLDVAGAYDFLISRGYKSQNIGIISISLGAGTSVLALPLMPEIGGLVLDSPYAEIRTLIERELPGRSSLPKFFAWGISFWARITYNIKFDEMVPREILSNYPQKELLIIHGTDDNDIPVQDSIELAKASPKSELWIVPETGHVKAYERNPQEYINRVSLYFNKVLSE